MKRVPSGITWLPTFLPLNIKRLYCSRYLHRGGHALRTAADFHLLWLSSAVATNTVTLLRQGAPPAGSRYSKIGACSYDPGRPAQTGLMSLGRDRGASFSRDAGGA